MPTIASESCKARSSSWRGIINGPASPTKGGRSAWCVRGEGQKGSIRSVRGSGSSSANNPSVGSTPPSPLDPRWLGHPVDRGGGRPPITGHEGTSFHQQLPPRKTSDDGLPSQVGSPVSGGGRGQERDEVLERTREKQYGLRALPVKKTRRSPLVLNAFGPISAAHRLWIECFHVHAPLAHAVRATPVAGSATGVSDVFFPPLRGRGAPRPAAPPGGLGEGGRTSSAPLQSCPRRLVAPVLAVPRRPPGLGGLPAGIPANRIPAERSEP